MISAILIAMGIGILAWAIENIFVTILAVLVIIAVIVRLVYVLMRNPRAPKPPQNGGAPSNEG